MADPTLLNNFLTALRASKSFNLLGKEEQDRLVQVFSAAGDAQLSAGIEALKQDEIKQKNLDEQLTAQQKKAAKLAEEIQAALKDIDKDDLKKNEAKDASESMQAAEQLLNKIGSASEEEKPKRKKLFGIF